MVELAFEGSVVFLLHVSVLRFMHLRFLVWGSSPVYPIVGIFEGLYRSGLRLSSAVFSCLRMEGLVSQHHYLQLLILRMLISLSCSTKRKKA
jgi:hypothetical protein